MDKNLLQAFAERAEQKQKDRAEVKEFDFPGIGKLPFQKMSQRDQLYLIGKITENADHYEKLMEAEVEMIFDCCPTLQDVELQKELGVVDPFDAVWKLLDVTEIQEVASKLTRWMGLIKENDKNEESPVKN